MSSNRAPKPSRRKCDSQTATVMQSHSSRIFSAWLEVMRGTLCLFALRVRDLSSGIVGLQSSYSRARVTVSRLPELPDLGTRNYKGQRPEKGAMSTKNGSTNRQGDNA